jgi:hypothetical protein
MKVTLTGRLSNALKKTGSSQGTSVDSVLEIYREGLKHVDWEDLEKEDKAKTGKYLSTHTIILGDETFEELKEVSEQTSLSPGEIFRTALWKGLRHSRTIGHQINFKDTETPIPQ